MMRKFKVREKFHLEVVRWHCLGLLSLVGLLAGISLLLVGTLWLFAVSILSVVGVLLNLADSILSVDWCFGCLLAVFSDGILGCSLAVNFFSWCYFGCLLSVFYALLVLLKLFRVNFLVVFNILCIFFLIHL